MMGVDVSEQDVLGCCASTRFAQQLAALSPFPDAEKLIATAQRVWWNNIGVSDWLQAFDAHPKIGEKKPATGEALGGASGQQQFFAFSAEEQAAAERSTTDAVATELRSLNASYLERFGFIFIICARGRPAPEILANMKRRMGNMPHEELFNAACEQMKITEVRLRALPQLHNQDNTAPPPCTAQRRADQVMAHLTGPAVQPSVQGPTLRSPITTHVLDTATGKPAVGLPLSLQRMDEMSRSWEVLSGGVTNEDGRVGNLLPATEHMPPGRYRMVFDTSAYLLACAERHPSFYHPKPFYPEVAVDFAVNADIAHEHFHIPLLLSPYGFSTYRGS